MLSPETNALKMLFLPHHQSYHAVSLWIELNNQKIESPGNEEESTRPEQPKEDPIRVRCGLLQYNTLTYGCCAGRYRYHKKTQKCCYGRITLKYSPCVPLRKCGLVSYNPSTHSCCGGRYLYNKKTQKCCYGRVISFYSTCRFHG